MHFCGGWDDLLYIGVALLPGGAFFWAWLKSKLHHYKSHHDCKDHENS